jgi:hypothetical protein
MVAKDTFPVTVNSYVGSSEMDDKAIIGVNDVLRCEYLFQPIKVESVTIKDQITMSGRQVRFNKDSLPAELARYYGGEPKEGRAYHYRSHHYSPDFADSSAQ